MLARMLILSGSSEGHILDAARPIIASAAEVTEAHAIDAHHHPRGQLLYALHGVMQVSLGGASWRVSPRMGVWIPGGVEHQVSAVAGIAYRSLFVQPAAAPQLSQRAAILQIPALTRELILEASTFGASYALHSPEARLIAVLQVQLARLDCAPASLPMPQDARARRVCQTLLENPADDRSLEAWGQWVGASSRTLARLFQRETGVSFGAWVQAMRLALALDRLAQGESVTRVALDLGYSSPSAFSAMFRRALGKTPRHFLS